MLSLILLPETLPDYNYSGSNNFVKLSITTAGHLVTGAGRSSE